MSEEEIKKPDIPGFTRERDPVDEWIAGGLLGVCMAGLLAVVSAPTASPLLKVALLCFAVALPYWGVLFLTFKFQSQHGLRVAPEVLGGCMSVMIGFVTIGGIAALFAHVWRPAGGLFLACALLFSTLSARYHKGDGKES
jgi:hypothetical protein